MGSYFVERGGERGRNAQRDDFRQLWPEGNRAFVEREIAYKMGGGTNGPDG